MNKIQRQRLEKLATHLEKGKLFHDKFDFGVWHSENCKSEGCAFGEASYLFPKLLSRKRDVLKYEDDAVHYDIVLASDHTTVNISAACEIFGLTWGEASALFTAGRTCPRVGLTKPLQWSASRKAVADRIWQFLANKDITTKAEAEFDAARERLEKLTGQKFEVTVV